MFYEWVSHGAEIGITAFFALITFALFCAAVIGLLAIGQKIMGGDNERSE